MKPKVRSTELVVHALEGEVVVYDKLTKHAHRLNETAAQVWERADGERTVEEIASDLACDENVVLLALDDLAAASLLEETETSITRREAINRAAVAAAVGFGLPAITSIVAPKAAEAQSDWDWGGGDPDRRRRRRRRRSSRRSS